MAVQKEPESEKQAFVSGTEAVRLSGLSWAQLYRKAMLGVVGVQLMPGQTARYNRADAMALRRSEPQAVGA